MGFVYIEKQQKHLVSSVSFQCIAGCVYGSLCVYKLSKHVATALLVAISIRLSVCLFRLSFNSAMKQDMRFKFYF